MDENGGKRVAEQLPGGDPRRRPGAGRPQVVVAAAEREGPLQPHSLLRGAGHHRLRRDRSPPLLAPGFVFCSVGRGDSEPPGEEHEIGEHVLEDLESCSQEKAARG